MLLNYLLEFNLNLNEPVVLILLGVIVVFIIILAILLTVLIKNSSERKRNKKNMPNLDLLASNPPTPEEKREEKQGPLVVKIDTTQVNTMINNFLEKLADDLVAEEAQQKYIQMQADEAKALAEPKVEERIVYVQVPQPQPEVKKDDVEIVEEKVEHVEEEKVVEEVKAEPVQPVVEEKKPEPVVEEEPEEEEISVIAPEPVKEEEPENPVIKEIHLGEDLVAKVEVIKERTVIFPEPKTIAKYATDTYQDEIEIRYGTDEENFKIYRKKKCIFILSRSNNDYKITFQRKPISVTKLLNKYPKACSKATSPEGEQWYKIANKGQIEEADILGLVDSSVKYMQDLEAKEAAKKLAAKEREKAKKAKAKQKIKDKEKAKKDAIKAKEKAKVDAKKAASKPATVKKTTVTTEIKQTVVEVKQPKVNEEEVALKKAQEAEAKAQAKAQAEAEAKAEAKAKADAAKAEAKAEAKAKEKAKLDAEKAKAKEKAKADAEKAKAKEKAKADAAKAKEKEKAKAAAAKAKEKEKEKAAAAKAKAKEKEKEKAAAAKAKEKEKEKAKAAAAKAKQKAAIEAIKAKYSTPKSTATNSGEKKDLSELLSKKTTTSKSDRDMKDRMKGVTSASKEIYGDEDDK